MKLGVAIAIAVLAGSAKAPGQNGFNVHLNALQAGRSGTGIAVREVPGGYLVFCRQFSHDGTGKQHMFTRRLNGTGALVNENEYTYGDNRHITFGYLDAVADNPDGTHTAAVTEAGDMVIQLSFTDSMKKAIGYTGRQFSPIQRRIQLHRLFVKLAVFRTGEQYSADSGTDPETHRLSSFD